MKPLSLIFAVALTVCALPAGASHGHEVRPDQIAELQHEGKLASFDKLNGAILAAHSGGRITKTQLTYKAGRYTYKAHVFDGAGNGWSMQLDGGTAQVLIDRKDDPPAPVLTVPVAPAGAPVR